MAISQITTYANPSQPSSPYTSCYAYAAGLGLDASNSTGTVTYNVHPTSNDWTGTPLGQVRINLGDVLVKGDPTANPPVPDTTMPTLAELMQDTAFANAYNTIGQIIDGYAVKHPSFAGGTASGTA